VAQENTMNRAKFLMLTALAVACAGFLTLSEPADARLLEMTPRGASALVGIRLSDDAMALAGFVALVCSNHAICGQ
jgi:hypothetical protein